MIGDGGADTLDGGSGNDTLRGEAGHDSLSGGDGADWIEGFTGRNTIMGGSGLDTLWGGADDEVIDGGIDNDRIYASGGNDLVRAGTGNDNINGGDGADTLRGDGGSDTYNFVGFHGLDIIPTLDADDWIFITAPSGYNVGISATGDVHSVREDNGPYSELVVNSGQIWLVFTEDRYNNLIEYAAPGARIEVQLATAFDVLGHIIW